MYQVKYPFSLVRHNQSANGSTESETTFEGFATFFQDDETGGTWEVEAWVTGFTQYQDGKAVSSVTGLKTRNWTVPNLEKFEADCVDAACYQQQLKAA